MYFFSYNSKVAKRIRIIKPVLTVKNYLKGA